MAVKESTLAELEALEGRWENRIEVLQERTAQGEDPVEVMADLIANHGHVLISLFREEAEELNTEGMVLTMGKLHEFSGAAIAAIALFLHLRDMMGGR